MKAALGLTRTCAGACVGLIALAQVASAQVAAPAPSLVLVGAYECEPARYDADALWRALQVELAALGVQAQRVDAAEPLRDAAASALASVAIECAEHADELTVRVSDAGSGKELTRTLAVADVAPAARPRALALAVVALLESSWSEVVVGSESVTPRGALPAAVQEAVRARLSRKLTPPEPAASAPLPSEKPPRAAPATSFEASAALRVFPGRSTGLLGLQLGMLQRVTAAMRLAFVAEALWGRSDLSDAEGKIGVMQLYWLTAGGGLSFHTASQPEIACGPRVLIGYGLADASATRDGARADNASGLVITALLAASVQADLGEVHLLTGADIGYALAGVVFLGDQARLSGMADTTFMLRAGLGW